MASSEDGLFQTVKELPSNGCREFGEQTESSSHNKRQVVRENDVEIANPLHATKVAQKVEVGDSWPKGKEELKWGTCQTHELW